MMDHMKPDYIIIAFKSPAEWRQWLELNHTGTDGIWMRLYKKASGVPSINYAQALDEALCFGWIDGQVKKGDELSYLQKFTPRRQRSLWSKRNVEYIARLTKAGLMMPAGLAEVERAKADGRWDAAYDRPSEMVASDEFLAALAHHPKAEAFYGTLNKSSRYVIAWSLQTAKTEATRLRRQEKFIAMLAAEQKP
jgi:uncharacterized protein YdeI (YjbR/CyaY-like superfamily)